MVRAIFSARMRTFGLGPGPLRSLPDHNDGLSIKGRITLIRCRRRRIPPRKGLMAEIKKPSEDVNATALGVHEATREAELPARAVERKLLQRRVDGAIGCVQPRIGGVRRIVRPCSERG